MLVNKKHVGIAALSIACGGWRVMGDEPKQPPAPAPVPAPSTPAPQAGATSSSAMADLVAQAIKRKKEGKLPNGADPATAAPEVQPVALSEVINSLGQSVPGKGKMVPIDLGGIGEEPTPTAALQVRPGDRVFIARPPEGGMPEIPAAEPVAAPKPVVIDTGDGMEDAWVKAGRPGPNHDLLDIFVGTWNVEATFDNGPGHPVETGSGAMVNTWQLQGRWIQQQYTGQMATMGRFSGIGYLGYDNIKQQFTATWMDTLTTTCLNSAGSFDEATSSFTLTAKITPAGGASGEFTQKQVIRVVSPDKYRVTMYLAGPDGAEFKTGELEYTRAVVTYTNADKK